MSNLSQQKHITVDSIKKLKSKRNISALTAYDYAFARLIDNAGVDIILVGDSLGNVIQGKSTTISVTLDDIIYHTKCVMQGVNRCLVVMDMPFLSMKLNLEDAVRNAGRALQETNAHAIKVEGGLEMIDTIKKLTDCGIPVMAHVGLQPQKVLQTGGYKVQCKEAEEKELLIRTVKALEEAGAFSVVLELIPADLAKQATAEISIPTIGIGAGPFCDGQILVSYDMLGIDERINFKHSRKFANLSEIISEAVKKYIEDITTQRFPNSEETYSHK
jgi:3-methyl-2-oxobutanoate hydroxymethyltransferase